MSGPAAPASDLTGRRIALCWTVTTEAASPRDPTTTGFPAVSRLITVSSADRSVAMSASQNPTNGAWVASKPVRTASPLPGRGQRSNRTGTGLAGQRRASSPVASVLALSTTRTAVRTGRLAALWHSAPSPSGSLRASLWAGTMISIDAVEWPPGGMVVTARPGQRVPY